jgi:SSS family solute:Na+ symporter
VACAIILTLTMGPANSQLAASIAMVVPFIVTPIVSLFTPKVDEEIINKAFINIDKK